MNANTTKVSIIVPIFNVEYYLTECLESIINQSFREFEAILIDDGSSDNSPAICDHYCSRDNRFHVFHDSNHGVSNARNTGLSKARGEWIMFLDADDVLDSRALEEMINAAASEDIDIVGCSFSYLYKNTIIPFAERVSENEGVLLEHEKLIHNMLVFPEMVREYYPTCLVPWGKIIKRRIIVENSLQFDMRLFLHEDALFNSFLFLHVRRQKVIDKQLIYYRQRDNSSTKSNSKDYFKNNKMFLSIVFEVIYLILSQICSSNFDIAISLVSLSINSSYLYKGMSLILNSDSKLYT